MLWVLDLDGVVWLGGRPIPGGADAVGRLRDAGQRLAFVTNNAGPTRAVYVQRLAAAGVHAEEDELVTSAQAAASLVEPGASVAMVGDDGLHEALVDRQVQLVAPADDPAAVVVGRTIELDHEQLAAAASAIRAGARFVATNADATFPSPTGLLPGAGALIAYLATASGRRPEVAGKPNQAIADLVQARYGPVGVMVGDRPDTDGRFANRVHARFALVLTGVTGPGDLPVSPAPDVVGADLGRVVADILDGR